MAEQTTDEGPKNPLWLDDLRPGAEGEGFLEKSLRHSLMFIHRPGNRLLVTFDNLSNVNDDSLEREPWAFKFARDNGHSHLGVMAHVSDWYRDGALIKRFEDLAAQGFFDGYERVVFAGVSMGAFAAVSFSSLVPGAHVVAINPQSTLDPDLVPWETRYENGRRQDWSLPFGDGAALTAGAGRVSIFYDPYHALDQQHVDRFSGDNIRIFKCRHSSHKTAVFLRKIGALKEVMTRAIMDDLSELDFYRMYRARRNLPWYRGSVSAYFRDSGREALADHFDMVFRRLRKRAKDNATVTGASVVPSVQNAVQQRKHGSSSPQARVRVPEGAGGAASAVKGQDRRVIVTTMKNEGPFMLEWIAYNRLIGFSDFLIYTNDCADGTDLIAKRLEELGLAQHRQNPFKPGHKQHRNPQLSALSDAGEQELVQNADWLICADCDEFLNVRVGEGRLDDLFAAVGDADAISVCWKLFGNSGQMNYCDLPIIEQFDRACGEQEYPNYRALGMKTLVRNNERFKRMRVHRPAFHLDRGDIAWVDGGGKPMPDHYLEKGWRAMGGFSHDFARLHHYAVRSVDSFLVKRDRGRTNHTEDDQGVSYWSNMNFNSDRDISLHARLPGLRKELDLLLKDPELSRLYARATDWHRGKIEELRQREGWAAFREEIAVINAVPEPQEG